MSSIPLGTKGVAYILSNGAYPGILKIGATTLPPEERARQLSAATGCPLPFTLVYSRDVPDVNAAEAAMHTHFADRRVNQGREFFQCSVLEACLALDRIAGGPSELTFDPPTPWADLFATFPDDDGSPRDLTEEEQAQCRHLAADLAAERRAYGAETEDEMGWREAA